MIRKFIATLPLCRDELHGTKQKILLIKNTKKELKLYEAQHKIVNFSFNIPIIFKEINKQSKKKKTVVEKLKVAGYRKSREDRRRHRREDRRRCERFSLSWREPPGWH